LTSQLAEHRNAGPESCVARNAKTSCDQSAVPALEHLPVVEVRTDAA
jgi:hypothetical protein